MVLIYVADYLSTVQGKLSKNWGLLVRPLFVTGVTLGLILVAKDIGTPFLMACVVGAMLFVSGARLKQLGAVCLAVLPIVLHQLFFVKYRRDRILSFLHPESDPGNNGYQLNVNTNSILASAKQGSVYTVPTISVGFNSVPWHGERYPMMSKEDFAAAQKWVKDEYFPNYPKEKWQENFVMLSTWNEYGEGTYIMPTTDEKGFQYLDVLREAYTDEKADASVNTVPTEAQLTRINRLYPQYRRLLRKEGYYTEKVDESALEVVSSIEYGKVDKLNVWSFKEGYVKDENGVTGTSSGTDPILQINDIGFEVDLSKVSAVRVTAKIPKGHNMQLFFTTEAGSKWTEAQARTLTTDSDDMKQYLFVMSDCPNWTGDLIGLRFDPCSVADVEMTIKSVEFMAAPEKASKDMTINGLTFEMKLPYQTAENGDVLVPFDPSVGMDFRLNTYYVWDKATGKLTLNFKKHTLVYTVGSDTYTLDGAAKSLGYKFDKFDGLPLIPMKKLCEDVGFCL